MIEVKGVTKQFKDKKAVDGISFTIQKGSVTAILGPNGAGKTTLISMMLGLLDPSAGHIRLGGQPPKSMAARDQLGAMLQEVSVIDGITVGETLDLFRSYYSHPMSKERLLEWSGLQGEQKKRADSLSGGQKRRLGFAIALAGDPDLLFLDEPTVGMDITSRKLFWESIHRLTKRGKTIILTTHYLEEAEHVADRVILMSAGKVIADGTPEEMKASLTHRSVSFTADGILAVDALTALPHVKGVSTQGSRMTVTTTDTDAVLRDIFSRNLPVHDIAIENGSLDEVFEVLMKREEIA